MIIVSSDSESPVEIGTMTDATSSSPQRYKRGRTGSMHTVDGSISIRFSAPENATQGGQLGTADAQHKCTAYLGSQHERAPRFSVKLHGQVQSPELEVVLQKALLKRLPLLKDVERSTSSSKPSDIHLPCTVWALVSLLILIDSNVTVKEWFEGEPNGGATLPVFLATRLLCAPAPDWFHLGARYRIFSWVADFMACADISQQLVSWLQDQLSIVVDHCSKSSTTHSPKPPNSCFLTKALQHVGPEHAKNMLMTSEGKLRFGVRAAMSMPQHFLKMWVASATPNLDLQDTFLTPAQWSRMAVCIAQLPPGEVLSLQISVEECIRWCADEDQSRCLSMNFKNTLGSMEGVVSPMSHLNHFGLRKLRLSPVMLPALEQLLSNLPKTVTKLTVSTSSCPREEFTSIHKLMLFRAVVRVAGLVELHMNDWERFVGSDACMVTEPLQSLPGLKIFVPRIWGPKKVACPPGLSFFESGMA